MHTAVRRMGRHAVIRLICLPYRLLILRRERGGRGICACRRRVAGISVAGGVESCSDSIHSSDISDVLEVVDVCIREGYQLSKRSKLENWSESGEVAYG
jgi:hypothetical protein